MAKVGGVLHTVLLVVIGAAALGALGVSIAVLVNQVNQVNNVQNQTVFVDQQALLNIKAQPEITPNDPRFQSYQQVVNLFKRSINTTIDPCTDFYKYTCGAFPYPMGFDVSDTENVMNMVSQFTNKSYMATAPKSVQSTGAYFDKCVDARQNWDKLYGDGAVVYAAINRYAAGLSMNGTALKDTTFPFPMLQQKTDVKSWPTPIGLGYLIGQLAGAEGIPTIVSTFVDTNWKDPYGPDGFAYFIDQPVTFLSNSYYLKEWGALNASLIRNINDTMNILAAGQKTVLDQTQLTKDIVDIVNFDYLLATQFSTDDTTRRQFDRSYNPNTMGSLKASFPEISWHTLVPLATGPAQHVLYKIFANYDFFIAMEPMQLRKLLNAFVDGNQFNITPRTVVNYMYYRLVDAYSDFLPSLSSGGSRRISRISKYPVGKPRHIVPEKRKYERRQTKEISDAQVSCAFETVDVLMYTNARLFIDKVYPTADSRQQVRDHVAKVASSIVVGFRSMLDQLSWMTSSTKTGAYSKIDHLVKNVAYPDWIANDTLLDQYHQPFNVTANMKYSDMLYQVGQFNIYVMYDQLVVGPADRLAFNGPPGVTNAWYQPELNSITFPAGILKQPFYDFNWPSSVNFGAMGVIAGHELTHGFDDQGVQWNGVGVLSGWMDNSSRVSFTDMAGCVVNEYSGFCPLDKAKYGAGACIDGAQTQGENIADNGGIHAAYRAYKNYVNLYGEDPNVPDDLLKDFTPDQLFFLSFASVWCQSQPNDNQLLRQILLDVHSPSQYRVLGTIQNMPAFKNAFHCPVSTYAPKDYCNVWVSDIDTVIGEPVIKKDTNIKDLDQITATNIKKYNAYKQAVDYYSKSINTDIDPCDDFFGYACGNFHQPVSFTTARAQNLVYMAQQLELPSYQATIKNSTALTKEKQLYNACLNATASVKSEDQLRLSNNYVMKKVNKLAGLLGQNFSLIFNNVASLPTQKQLSDALGYLSFEEGIDTLVTPLVDTKWKDNTKGYMLFMDQNTAYLSKTYYSPGAWAIERPAYLKMATDVLTRFAKEQNVNFDGTGVGDVIDYEQYIAQNFSTDDTTRRTFTRSWNPKTVSDMNKAYPFIDWTTYFSHVPKMVKDIVTDPAYQLAVMEVDQFKAFNDAYAKLDATKLVNLLFLRLILANAQFLPSYSTAFEDMPEPSPLLGLTRRKIIENFKFGRLDLENNGPACAGVANNMLQFVNGRVFIDYMYPTSNDVKNIRQAAGGVIQNVITSFQGMIDQLDWMTVNTKEIAYNKTANIQQNIAFPDWIADNTLLDKYHADLVFDVKDNYYDMLDKLTKFNILVQYRQLTFPSTDRTDFLGQPGTVNAWYQPELNSITFPAGILVPPYYNPDWPTSVNYGGLGLVAGHELTHGFDDGGVQWDSYGNLNPWMDNSSTIGFNNMAACVIKEYGGFCPLDATAFTPNCVNGAQTQGENIADNGGVHASFRAYKTHLSLDGPEALLPDRLFGQFSHDQLFFLSFAQVWCETRRSDANLYRQLMVDPHSPSMYRVQGTIQNYPAFQSAFNCKKGSRSAPNDACHVWVPNTYA